MNVKRKQLNYLIMKKKNRSSSVLTGQRSSSQISLAENYDQSNRRKSSSSLEQKLIELNVSKPIINVILRTVFTFIMVGAFSVIVVLGPIYLILLVLALQTLIFKEIINLASQPNRIRNLPWFRAINTFFLLTTHYYFFGDKLGELYLTSSSPVLYLVLSHHHKLSSFVLYCIGFIWFVFNLKKGHYKFQFYMFAFTHMTLILVVMSSNFMSLNIMEGLIWFTLPISLVICNDICAYITGRLFGKHKLIKISPNKTWEGFIGGLFLTVLFGVKFSGYLARYSYLVCPLKNSINVNFFNPPVCNPNPVFVVKTYVLTTSKIYSFVQNHIIDLPDSIKLAPIAIHSLAFSSFASLIAPFGGFFSSGLKRAFKIKDFGNSIPGHGGVTDRMDCQFFMALFAYLYHSSFIKYKHHETVVSLLQNISSSVDEKTLVEFYYLLKEKLCNLGYLNNAECSVLNNL